MVSVLLYVCMEYFHSIALRRRVTVVTRAKQEITNPRSNGLDSLLKYVPGIYNVFGSCRARLPNLALGTCVDNCGYTERENCD